MAHQIERSMRRLTALSPPTRQRVTLVSILRLMRILVWLACSFTLVACPAFAQTPPAVLLMDQGFVGSPWYDVHSSAFREALGASAQPETALHVEHLDFFHFNDRSHRTSMATYLKEKYRRSNIKLIVAVGPLALEFALGAREELGLNVPLIFSAVDDQTVSRLRPTNATGTILQYTLRDQISVARALLPELEHFAVVGDPLEKQSFLGEFRRELPAFAKELNFIDLTGLPMDEVKARVAALPNKTVIVYTGINVDGAGVSYIPRNALRAVAEVANAPIVIDAEPQIGYGGVGGFVAGPSFVAKDTAQLASRILGGQSVSTIPVAAAQLRPVFDWHQLERWGVAEDRLPQGSEIRFRPLSPWEQYRLQVSVAIAALILQSGLIFWLLIEHHRRSLAETEAGNRRREVIHLNRTATATVLSSSIAHELNQPLGAILSNAETIELLLKNEPLDREEISEIVADIRRDDLRAAEIIQQLRTLLRKRDDVSVQISDLNSSVRDVVRIAAPEAAKRRARITTDQVPGELSVRANNTHLQQVILNLVMNSLDALQDSNSGGRLVSIQTLRSGMSEVEVKVSDTGKGIPGDQLQNVFEAFFTTKPEGTGLGLPISRTIIESYGGTLRAENRAGTGAMFSFTLPLAESPRVA